MPSCGRPTRACSTSGSSSATPTVVPAADVTPPVPENITANERAFTVLVRNAMFRRVELAALNRWQQLGELEAEAGSTMTAEDWRDVAGDVLRGVRRDRHRPGRARAADAAGRARAGASGRSSRSSATRRATTTGGSPRPSTSTPPTPRASWSWTSPPSSSSSTDPATLAADPVPTRRVWRRIRCRPGESGGGSGADPASLAADRCRPGESGGTPSSRRTTPRASARPGDAASPRRTRKRHHCQPPNSPGQRRSARGARLAGSALLPPPDSPGQRRSRRQSRRVGVRRRRSRR